MSRTRWCLEDSNLRALLRLATIVAGLSLLPPIAAQTIVSPRDLERLFEIRRILREASHSTRNIENGAEREAAAANVAGEQAHAGDFSEAFETVASLPDTAQRAWALGGIAGWQAHAGYLAGALQTLAAAQPGAAQAIAYAQIAESVADAGHFSVALAVAAQIREQPAYRVGALTRIAQKQWKAGDRQGASETLSQALTEAIGGQRGRSQALACELCESASLLAQISAAQAAIGDRAGALATVERVRTLAAATEDETWKEIILQRLAIAQADMGDTSLALQTVQELLPHHFRDSSLFQIAAQEAERQDFHAALEISAAITERLWRCQALLRIAESRAGAGDLPAALETAESVPDNGCRAEALERIAFLLAERGDPQASTVIELALNSAKESRDKIPSHVFEFLAVARARLGDIAEAMEILGDLKAAKARSWPLWNLTEFMVTRGDAAGALALAEHETAPLAKTYALLGTAQGMLRQLEAEVKGPGAAAR